MIQQHILEHAPFRNRAHAGRELAKALERHRNDPDLLIIGIPRGGIPVAFEVACALGAPLGFVMAQKVVVPARNDLVLGAACSNGFYVLNGDAFRHAGLTAKQLDHLIAMKVAELRQRESAYPEAGGRTKIQGRSIVLVDDGMTSGSTAEAALNQILNQGPESVTLATPCSSSDAFERVDPLTQDFVSLQSFDSFKGLSHAYEDLSTIDDRAAIRLILRANS